MTKIEKISAKKNHLVVTATWKKEVNDFEKSTKYQTGFSPSLIMVKDNQVDAFEALVKGYIAHANLVDAKRKLKSANDALTKAEEAEKAAIEALRKANNPVEEAKATLERNEASLAVVKADRKVKMTTWIAEQWEIENAKTVLPDMAVIPAVVMASVTDSVAYEYYVNGEKEERKSNFTKFPYDVFASFSGLLVEIKRFWADNADIFEEKAKPNKLDLQKLSRNIHAKFGNSIYENDMFNAWSYGNLKRGDLTNLLTACHGCYKRDNGLTAFSAISDNDALEQIALHMVDLWERKPVPTIGHEHAVSPETTFEAKEAEATKKVGGVTKAKKPEKNEAKHTDKQ
jgi:hypothetical protein